MKKSLLVLSLLSSSWLLGYGEYQSIQERAKASSITGSNLSNASLFVNPAAAAFTNTYSMEATYSSPQDFAASIMDTKTSKVGGGLAYFRSNEDRSKYKFQGAKLSMTSRVSNILAFGISGKALWGTSAETGPLDTVISKANFKDIDVGTTMRWKMLQLGAVLRNVLGGSQQLNQNKGWSFGGQLNYENTILLSMAGHADASMTFNEYGAGLEYVSPNKYSVKGGYRYQPTTKKGFWSVGASVNSPKVTVNYALQIPQQKDENNGMKHTIALAFLM